LLVLVVVVLGQGLSECTENGIEDEDGDEHDWARA